MKAVAKETFEPVILDGQIVLCTSSRIDRNTIPKGILL